MSDTLPLLIYSFSTNVPLPTKINSKLKELYPDFVLIGEESASDAGSYSVSDAPTFIIDPLDGTTNAVHRIPAVCCCWI